MKKFTLIVLFLLTFLGCNDTSNTKQINPEQILTITCAKCHNLSMPPKIHKIELAPPMMAVVFHLKDFIKTSNPSEHKIKFSNFVSDYILYPAKDKAYCDKNSLKQYGLMPSLENNISKDEANVIAKYIYEKYDAQKFYKKQKEEKLFNALAKGEQIARKNSCFSCHSLNSKKIAPSFTKIKKQSTNKDILNSLLNGSKGKYKGFEKSYMPPLGKNISTQDLKELSNWILSL